MSAKAQQHGGGRQGSRWAEVELLPSLPGEALHTRVARTLRDAVQRGVLVQGQRLPGHRGLAAALGVSRNTLVDALSQLEAEGYLQAEARSGTRIAVPPVTPTPDQSSHPLPLSAWATRALAGRVPDAGGAYAVDFRVGQPVAELYPAAAWALALARRAEQIAPSGMAGNREEGLGPLETRRALASALNAERGAQVTPDMILLTGGTQWALDALARVFLEVGRVAAIEDPTYPGARSALAATGAQLVPVAVDGHGLDPAALPPQATLLYLTPACQYPTTAALPVSRAQAVVAWARGCGAFILEDDYAADLHHQARPPAVMQGLAPDRVILLGSFSKSLAPVTRSGYLVAPPGVVQVLAGTRPLTDRAPGVLDALALADLLESGSYARHLRRARQSILHRQEVLREALAQHLPDWTPLPTRAGLHLYVTLPPGVTEARALARAHRVDVALTPVSPLAVHPRAPAVLMAFAHLGPETIRDGVRRIAEGVGRGM